MGNATLGMIAAVDLGSNSFHMVVANSKNSSRVLLAMHRNFTRSNRGFDSSIAWASTRRLNWSWLNSRLM